MKRFLKVIGLVSLAACSVWAGTATSNMSVLASVSNNCVISAGALSFNSYDPIVANVTNPLTGTATLQVTCTDGASTNITLDQGTHAAAGSTPSTPLRQLKIGSGSDVLSYVLTQDSAGTLPWADSSAEEAYTGTGLQTTVTVYGSVAGGQTSVHAGSYSDTIVVTITF
jgi:spore coat protein U-like protein